MAEPRGPTSKIEIRTLVAKETATVRETVARDDVTETLGRTFQAVHAALSQQGIEPSGSPFARYHEFGNSVDLEAGLPVASAIQPEGTVKPSQLPAGPAAIAVHVGPYEGLSATYDAISTWMQQAGRAASGGPWEIYLTDPSTEPDPAKWLTEILWPMRKG